MQKQQISTIDTNKDVIATIEPDLEIPNESINNREEILKQMLLDCQKMIVCEKTEDCFGTWFLIDDSNSNEILNEQTEPDCALVLTSTNYIIVYYDETFQKVVSLKQTPLASIVKIEVGSNPLSPPNSSWTLRIHYLKDEQTSGYYHQFRGTYVQVFNTSIMFVKTIEEINDYLKTIGQMITSITNNFAQKSIDLNETTLNRMDSLPDDVEPLQRRMSFTAIATPPLSTSNNRATFDKIKNFGSRFSSMVTRQAAPTINKLTTQAKQLPINETVTSLLKVINEGQSLIRASTTKSSNEDGRASPTTEMNRKKVLQEKFDERKKDLSSTHCQTKCFLLPSPDLTIIYIPNNDQNN